MPFPFAAAALLGSALFGRRSQNQQQQAQREDERTLLENRNRQQGFENDLTLARTGRQDAGNTVRSNLLRGLMGGLRLGGNVEALRGLQGQDISSFIPEERWSAVQNPMDLPDAPKFGNLSKKGPSSGGGISGFLSDALGMAGRGLAGGGFGGGQTGYTPDSDAVSNGQTYGPPAPENTGTSGLAGMLDDDDGGFGG